jgi:hypothetical protein
MRNLTLACGVCLVLVACEGGRGGSGIAGTRVISTLSDSELVGVCNDARVEFPERTITCADDVRVTVGIGADDCTTNDFLTKEGCEATVDEVLDCVAEFGSLTDAEACEGLDGPPPGCSSAVVACFPN